MAQLPIFYYCLQDFDCLVLSEVKVSDLFKYLVAGNNTKFLYFQNSCGQLLSCYAWGHRSLLKVLRREMCIHLQS